MIGSPNHLPKKLSMMQHFFLVALFLLILAFSQPTKESLAPISVAAILQAPLLVGFNEEYRSLLVAGKEAGWRLPPVQEIFENLHPRLIRFPGGTFSDFYDWRQECLVGPIHHPGISNSQVPMTARSDQEGFLQMCSKIGAEGLFVLNLYQTNAPSQVDWIKSLVEHSGGSRAGRVELGNELHLHPWHSGLAWGKGEIPNVGVYLERARPVGRELLRRYPKLRVAVNADNPEYLFHEGVEQNTEWNMALGKNPDFFNAVSMHIYLYHQPSWKAEPHERFEWFCGLADELPGALAEYQTRYFGKLPLWITEFGLTGRESAPKGEVPEQAQWGFVLAEINAILRLMENPGPLEVLLKHAAANGSGFRSAYACAIRASGEVVTKPMPNGLVYGKLFEICGAPHQWEKWNFSDAGSFPGRRRLEGKNFPALIGGLFRSEKKSLAYVVNRGSISRRIELPAGSWSLSQWHGELAQNILELNEQSSESPTFQNNILLEPYSVLIAKKNP